jgi:hypothetical protein
VASRPYRPLHRTLQRCTLCQDGLYGRFIATPSEGRSLRNVGLVLCAYPSLVSWCIGSELAALARYLGFAANFAVSRSDRTGLSRSGGYVATLGVLVYEPVRTDWRAWRYASVVQKCLTSAAWKVPVQSQHCAQIQARKSQPRTTRRPRNLYGPLVLIWAFAWFDGSPGNDFT